jgi:hypothetical protein
MYLRQRVPERVMESTANPTITYNKKEADEVDTSVDTLSNGVPPKSPDHSDVNASRIATQTHQEVCSPKMSEDVWHYTHPPETSAGTLVPPRRCDAGVPYTSLHFSVLKKLSANAFSVGCPGVDMLMVAPISSSRSTYAWLLYCLPRSE